ncbi:MAG: lysophospholipid acyltransferase family protein [Crocinitomicaceae bacterium]|nr:lysophospholipid acyltransferase family protein [Crocinitomicaceae bacterium]
MLYKFLKLIIGIGIRLYYKEIRIKHIEHLNNDGPKIIIANHPNTLMDAWMVGYICNEPIFYMAKGTFFNSKFKVWALKSLGLIPVNRTTESATKGVSNQSSFEHCYRLLEAGRTLVIFPEGNSFQERQLRMLKSGAARIALEVERRNEGKLNVQVIPVGLVYLKPEKFRSSVLVSVGKGIDPKPYLKKHEINASGAAKELTEEFRVGLGNLLVGSTSSEHDTLVDDIVDILSSDYLKTGEKGVQKDVSLLRSCFERINEVQINTPDKLSEITQLVYRIKWQLEKLEIKSDFLDRSYNPRMFVRQLIFSTIFLLIGLPLFAFGLIHNALPYKLTDVVVGKIVKDLEYYAPIAVLVSLILYPLTYIGCIYLVDYFHPLTFWWWLTYLALMPLLGMFAWFFYKYVGHVSFKTNYILLMSTQKTAINNVKEDRQKLREMLDL